MTGVMSHSAGKEQDVLDLGSVRHIATANKVFKASRFPVNRNREM